MLKFDVKTILIIVLGIFVVSILLKKEKYQMSYFQLEGAPIDFSVESKSSGGSTPPASMQPSEIPVTEDFAQFNTDYILSSQNYLDPRNQIGYPETVGGTLRNSNLQFRSEPPNPRDPVSIFNLSTIVPEQMRPQFEIQDSEYK